MFRNKDLKLGSIAWLLGLVGIVMLASCASSGDSSDDRSDEVSANAASEASSASSDAPIELLPIVEAFAAKTFAPWEAATSVFAPGSAGGLKWETLKRFQRSQIQEGDAETVFFWTSEERDSWTILRFCSDALSDGECSEYDESPELHVMLDGGLGTDLRWFQDEGDGPVEAMFFDVSSTNTEFLAADFGVKSALTLVDWTGAEKSCFFGELVINPELVASVEEAYFALGLYMTAQSVDGVSIEASSPSSGIIETRTVSDPIPYIACFEYPAESIESLGFPSGEFRLTILGDRRTNTEDVTISLSVLRI